MGVAALGLNVAAALYGVAVSGSADGGSRGWIQRTFPTDGWIFKIEGPSGGYMAVEADLEAVLKACLDALRLRPARPSPSCRTPLDAARFGPEALSQAAEPEAWADALSAALMANLEQAEAAEDAFRALMKELRTLGHDIYEFDSDGDGFVAWVNDWIRPRPGRTLTIELTSPAYEAPHVTVTVSDPTGRSAPEGQG